jgi:hypothetical protein
MHFRLKNAYIARTHQGPYGGVVDYSYSINGELETFPGNRVEVNSRYSTKPQGKDVEELVLALSLRPESKAPNFCDVFEGPSNAIGYADFVEPFEVEFMGYEPATVQFICFVPDHYLCSVEQDVRAGIELEVHIVFEPAENFKYGWEPDRSSIVMQTEREGFGRFPLTGISLRTRPHSFPSYVGNSNQGVTDVQWPIEYLSRIISRLRRWW